MTSFVPAPPHRSAAPSPLAGASGANGETQAAIVRTLAAELARYHPSDPRARALRAQLEEEEARLTARPT